MNRNHIERVILIASLAGLLCLLVYTFWHTGGLFSRYISPGWLGYVAAFGIESVIIGTSFRLVLQKHNRRFLVFVLGAAVMVSAFANVYEGFHTFYGEPLRVANLGLLDGIEAVVGLSVTFLISLLVFANSEVIGGDVSAIVARVERAERKAKPKVRSPRTHRERVHQYIERKHEQGEELPPFRQIADELGIKSQSTVYQHAQTFRNGK